MTDPTRAALARLVEAVREYAHPTHSGITGVFDQCVAEECRAARAALGAGGFDVEKAMDYSKGYIDAQQIMANENANLRARLADTEQQATALTAALARHHWGVGPGLAQHVTCPVCGLDARLSPRAGA